MYRYPRFKALPAKERVRVRVSGESLGMKLMLRLVQTVEASSNCRFVAQGISSFGFS